MAGYFVRPSLFLAGRNSWVFYFVVALLLLVISGISLQKYYLCFGRTQ